MWFIQIFHDFAYLSYILLLCDLFFFFKQKTAYEMRISDWSSDVCSSDLLRVKPSDNTAAAVLHFETGPQYRFGDFTIAQVDNGRQLDDKFQIGRASCRERVCQYV